MKRYFETHPRMIFAAQVSLALVAGLISYAL